MIRWLGLWRLVVGRVRSDGPFLAATWLLVASALTLLAAGTLYGETVEAGGVRRALLEAAPHERGVAVRLAAAPAELGELDRSVRDTLVSAFGDAATETVLVIRSSALQLAGAADAPRQLLVLGAYENLADHAELVSGRWPAPARTPAEASVSAGAAQALGLQTGDRLALADASTAGADPQLAIVEVEIVGIFDPPRDDPYWLGSELEVAGVEERAATPLVGPLMVDRHDLLAGPFVRLDAAWRAIPRAERLRLEQLDALRARIDGLQRAVEAVLPAQRFVVVDRDLSAVLGRIDRSALVSRSGVLLTTLQFGILAGYAVLLVGGILAERRRPEVALLRARGASTTEVGLIAAGEATLLALAAAAVAPALGLAIVETIGRWGIFGESGIITGAQLSGSTLAVAGAGGLAAIVALTAPALLAEVDLARVRAALGRPLSQTAAQRLGLDLVLLVVAAIGLIQLHAYGGTLAPSAGGRVDLDPLLVAAPAIALAAGAVLVVRLVPRVGELADWLVRRGRGAVLPYSARQTARRPLRYTRSALLIVLAIALGTFATLYSATWARSQVDQAAHQTGGELRVTRAAQSRTSPAEMAAGLAALPGVTAIAPVGRSQLDAGRAVPRTTLLAIEPESLAAVTAPGTAAATGAGGDAASSADWRSALDLLVDARRPPPTIALPADARRLAIVLDVDFRVTGQRGGPPIEPSAWPGVTVAPVIGEGADDGATLPAAAAAYRGDGQRLVFELPAGAAGRRLVLAALELAIGAPGETVGRLRLVGIEATASADGAGGWLPVADPAELEDWTFTFVRLGDAGFSFPRIVPGDELGGATIEADEVHSLPACGSWTTTDGCTGQQHLYRWAPRAAGQQLAALASTGFLAATGSATGETVSVYAGTDLGLLIVGELDSFPSATAGEPFVIVDAASLDRLRRARGLNSAEPTEWWLAVAAGQAAQVSERALMPPLDAQAVFSREALTRSLQRDPIALGMVGALLLGSLTAAAFAVIALLVSALVSAREQLGELALMRALGVSRRQVIGLIAIEHGFLIALGVVAGTALGMLIGLLVLPHAPLNRAGEPVVPSPAIVVPWELLGLLGVAALALVALSVLVAGREIGRRPLVDVLREREI